MTLSELAPYIVSLPNANPRLPPAERRTRVLVDWPALFNNSRPVEIEVGFGKGLFLCNAASSHPEINFLGIEVERKYQLYATQRLAALQLSNVKTCWADATLAFRENIPEATVQAVHIYFPDPWWKKKHKKKILMSPTFLLDLAKILRPEGLVYFVTDVADYFAMVLQLMHESEHFQLRDQPPDNEPHHDMDYLTHFERKFRLEGRPIYRAIFTTPARTPTD